MAWGALQRLLASALLLTLAACAATQDTGPEAVARRSAQSLAEKAKGDDFRDGKNGVGVDYTQSVKWYWLAVEHGNTGASNNLAAMYLNGLGVPADVPQAMKLYRLAASGGNSYAMVSLGDLAQKGIGGPKDEAEAARWYQRAVDTDGNTIALNQLALCYEN